MEKSLAVTARDGAVAEVVVYPDLNALVAGAADAIAREAAQAIAERGRFSIALSGGSTPKPVYARLAGPKGIDWSRVVICFGDERCVPPDDPQSNFRMARAALIDHIPIPAGNIHRMRGEDDPRRAAAAYADELTQALGEGWRLDLALQGLGDNGHTASLFPGLAAIEETSRPVVAAYVEVVGMWRADLDAPGHQRRAKGRVSRLRPRQGRRPGAGAAGPLRPDRLAVADRAAKGLARPLARRRRRGVETAADEMTAMARLPQQHADRVLRSCPMACRRSGAPGQRWLHGQAATTDRLTMGSSLSGAMVSMLM